MIPMVKSAYPFDPGRTPCFQSVSSPFRIDRAKGHVVAIGSKGVVENNGVIKKAPDLLIYDVQVGMNSEHSRKNSQSVQ